GENPSPKVAERDKFPTGPDTRVIDRGDDGPKGTTDSHGGEWKQTPRGPDAGPKGEPRGPDAQPAKSESPAAPTKTWTPPPAPPAPGPSADRSTFNGRGPTGPVVSPAVPAQSGSGSGSSSSGRGASQSGNNSGGNVKQFR